MGSFFLLVPLIFKNICGHIKSVVITIHQRFHRSPRFIARSSVYTRSALANFCQMKESYHRPKKLPICLETENCPERVVSLPPS